jgi:hypothetical protein
MKAFNYSNSKMYVLKVYVNEVWESSITLVVIWVEYFLEVKNFVHEAETYWTN